MSAGSVAVTSGLVDSLDVRHPACERIARLAVKPSLAGFMARDRASRAITPRRNSPHQFAELLEEIAGVVRPAAALRMVLHAEHRQLRVLQASRVLSFRLMCVGITSFGSVAGSTEKPWFCVVISIFFVSSFRTG